MRRLAAAPFDALALFALGIGLVAVCATFRDYGVAWDEQGETVYGNLLLDYYASGFHDRSAFEFVNLRFYGAGFELPASLVAGISPFGPYETRHLMSALLGLVGLAATWQIGRRLGGERTGAFGLVLLGSNPTWYGNLFINARDVPFASGMACCLLLSLRALDELPRLTRKTSALLGLALGLTLGVRVGGVMALGYLLGGILLWAWARARSGEGASLKGELSHVARTLLITLAVAYPVMVVLWPWAIQEPLNPLRALLLFSHFPFDSKTLFAGGLVPANALPASYLPLLLTLKTPEMTLLGLAAAAVLGLRALVQRPASVFDAKALRVAMVALAAVFPVLYFVVVRPVAYNGMRHFLFVLPPLSVLAGMAFDRLLRAAGSFALRTALGTGIALGCVAPVLALRALHPEEYVYFNALAGGPRGAQGRYELDYWGTSLAETTQQFLHELERRGERPATGAPAFKVYVCGNRWSASTFFPPWLAPVDRVEDAQFQIAIEQFFCRHPEGSRPVLQVMRAGAVLSYVDDLRKRQGS